MENEKNISPGMKIAILIILISFFYFFCVTFIPMTPDGTDQSKTIVGFLLGSGLGVLINYYWGNSSKKTQGDKEDNPDKPKGEQL